MGDLEKSSQVLQPVLPVKPSEGNKHRENSIILLYSIYQALCRALLLFGCHAQLFVHGSCLQTWKLFWQIIITTNSSASSNKDLQSTAIKEEHLLLELGFRRETQMSPSYLIWKNWILTKAFSPYFLHWVKCLSREQLHVHWRIPFLEHCRNVFHTRSHLRSPHLRAVIDSFLNVLLPRKIIYSDGAIIKTYKKPIIKAAISEKMLILILRNYEWENIQI